MDNRRQQRVILTHANPEISNTGHGTRILQNNSASAKLMRKSAGLGDRPLSSTNQHTKIDRHADGPRQTADDIFESCYSTTASSNSKEMDFTAPLSC